MRTGLVYFRQRRSRYLYGQKVAVKVISRTPTNTYHSLKDRQRANEQRNAMMSACFTAPVITSSAAGVGGAEVSRRFQRRRSDPLGNSWCFPDALAAWSWSRWSCVWREVTRRSLDAPGFDLSSHKQNFPIFDTLILNSCDRLILVATGHVRVMTPSSRMPLV